MIESKSFAHSPVYLCFYPVVPVLHYHKPYCLCIVIKKCLMFVAENKLATSFHCFQPWFSTLTDSNKHYFSRSLNLRFLKMFSVRHVIFYSFFNSSSWHFVSAIILTCNVVWMTLFGACHYYYSTEYTWGKSWRKILFCLNKELSPLFTFKPMSSSFLQR